MNETATVTISLSEYDRLREFYKLKSSPKQVCLSIGYNYANGSGSVVLISESKIIEELQHKINILEHEDYMCKRNELLIEKHKIRWFQF